MASQRAWASGPVLAWTEREGPGRPPAAPRRALCIGLAATLGVTFLGMLGTDALCPEHRAWVQGLAGLAVVGIVASIVGLVRGWPSAGLLTLLSAGAGVAIGFLDAAHDPTRGRMIALAFGVVAVLASWLAFRGLRLLRWDRSVAASLRSPLDAPVPQRVAASTDAVTVPARADDEDTTLPIRP